MAAGLHYSQSTAMTLFFKVADREGGCNLAFSVSLELGSSGNMDMNITLNEETLGLFFFFRSFYNLKIPRVLLQGVICSLD